VIQPMSRRDGEEVGTKVIVTVVVSDCGRATTAITPTEELKLAEIDVLVVETVTLAVELASVEVVIYIAEALGGVMLVIMIILWVGLTEHYLGLVKTFEV
jgi:hypothetical protein